MSLNRVFLLGNLGQDPELRYTPNKTPVCTLRLATNERRKGADGEWSDHTEWHTVVTFGKTAENCSQYLQKGRPVFVEGRIQTRKWQDQEGKDRYFTEVVANAVQFVGGKSSSDGMSVERTSSSRPSSSAAQITPSSSVDSVPFDDDDIPF